MLHNRPNQDTMSTSSGRRLESAGRFLLPFSLILVLSGCGNPLVPDPNVVYLAFGDSTTNGPTGDDYPDMLPGRLGVEPAAVAKRGSGGETTAEGLERLRTYLQRELFPNARVLLYWQGGADVMDTLRRTDPFLLLSPEDEDYPFSETLERTLDETQSNIETLIREAQHSGLTVVVATYYQAPEAVLPCDPLLLEVITPAQSRRANAYFSLLNERIREAAGNTGALLVDVENDAVLNVGHFHDCNHLNAAGNEIIADLVAARLQGAASPSP